MWQRLNIALAALLVALNARADALEGVWAGSYDCRQGATTLELFVTVSPTGAPLALFHFGDGSTDRPEGCFAMQGALAKGRLSFTAGRWLLRPHGYVSVDLSGSVNGDAYTGLVAGPGCAAFSLKWSPPAPPPSACQERETPTS